MGRCKVDGKYYWVPYWNANPPTGYYICTSCFETIFRREKNKERMRKRRASDPDFYEKYEKENSIRYKREHDNRAKIVMALGVKCICRSTDCWHTGPCMVDDVRAIELDHIFGNGKQHREEYQQKHYQMYAYYAKHLDEAKKIFQPLCMICNRIKGMKVADYTNTAINNTGPVILPSGSPNGN
jgi:hypothetical protein